jgi:hypothetical protein
MIRTGCLSAPRELRNLRKASYVWMAGLVAGNDVCLFFTQVFRKTNTTYISSPSYDHPSLPAQDCRSSIDVIGHPAIRITTLRLTSPGSVFKVHGFLESRKLLVPLVFLDRPPRYQRLVSKVLELRLDSHLGRGAYVFGEPHGEDLESRVRVGVGEEEGRVERLEVTDAERCGQIKDGKSLFLHLNVNSVVVPASSCCILSPSSSNEPQCRLPVKD